MSLDLYIQYHQDEASEMTLGYVRHFHHEIACGHLWYKKDSFLTQEEEDLFYPYIDGVHEHEILAILPEQFKAIVLKIWSYLESNQNTLPIEHFIDRIEDDSFLMDDANFDAYSGIIYKNSKCWLDGDTSHYYLFGHATNKDKARVVSYPGEPDEVDFWITVKERVVIDGRPYKMYTETRFQRYKDQLTLLLDFCDKAIKENKRINWISV